MHLCFRPNSPGYIEGAVAKKQHVAAVDNFICGEPERLQTLPERLVEPALIAACSAGQIHVVDSLLERHSLVIKAHLDSSDGFYPLWWGLPLPTEQSLGKVWCGGTIYAVILTS